MIKSVRIAAVGAALSLAMLSCTSDSGTVAQSGPVHVVGMRRLSEDQYRNSIADIFGPDIKVAGRFEPVQRPAQKLLSTGAAMAAISPAGFEQFDGMARSISAQVFDNAHRNALVKCTPVDATKADEKCAQKTMALIGRYVLRHPLAPDELAAYVKMADEAANKAGSFYKGLQLSLAAMLVAPEFLYAVENAEPDPAQPGNMRLDNYSRAARLSFLLWDTTPGDALLASAEKHQLTDQPKLETIATNMVGSPRLEQGVRAFFTDMLDYEKFEADDYAKDQLIYPRFNSDVAKALPEQLLRTIVDDLVVRNNDYRDLFTSRNTVMTRALGPLYNVSVPVSTGWVPYEFTADSGRGGLLSQAAFLALYSHPGRSSATLRGRAIRELLMCQPVPDPPGNVNFTAVEETHNKAMPTARDRLTAHQNNPVCAGCHRITDPMGLTLENFDGMGAFRATENDAKINATSTFDNKTIAGEVELGKALAADPAVPSCLANRALEYAAGHPADTAASATIKKEFADDGYKIKALFAQVATMPAALEIPKAAEPTKSPQSAMLTTN